jgi:hypothetical protein
MGGAVRPALVAQCDQHWWRSVTSTGGTATSTGGTVDQQWSHSMTSTGGWHSLTSTGGPFNQHWGHSWPALVAQCLKGYSLGRAVGSWWWPWPCYSLLELVSVTRLLLSWNGSSPHAISPVLGPELPLIAFNPLTTTRRYTVAHFRRFFTVLEYSPIGIKFSPTAAPRTLYTVKKKNFANFQNFFSY